MESEVTNERLYEVPFNILVCDISNDIPNNKNLLELLLGTRYTNLQTKELKQGERSYIHQEWRWLFTPTNFEEILAKLMHYSNQKNQMMNHTMLLFKTKSIADNPKITKLLNHIALLSLDNQPMTVFITNNKEDTKESIFNALETG